MPSRPLIALPGRFSESASALRYSALVNARALLQAVYDAGGDPVTVLPAPWVDGPDGSADRLAKYDGILMPGGADIDPTLYGQEPQAGTDAPDLLQDEFDIAVIKYAIQKGVPLLTVCRGTQLLNVALGGTLEQEMSTAHRHTIETVKVRDDLADQVPPAIQDALPQAPFTVSCYHHQRIDTLAPALDSIAFAGDGTIETVWAPRAAGWSLGVQWHPEDTAVQDQHQQQLLRAFIAACGTGEAAPVGAGLSTPSRTSN